LPTIRLSGQDVAYGVRRSERAKNVRLKVSANDGLVVIVPGDYDADDIPPILREKGDWIRKQLAYFATAPAWQPEGEPEEGQTVLLEGRPLVLRLLPARDTARSSTVTQDDDVLELALHGRDRGRARKVLERWLRERARERINDALNAMASARGISYGQIYVMDQRTRWANCSRLGNLSFNWRLVMAPPEVLRYVVAHEVAHLRERKHSPRFWLMVTGMVGDVEGPRRWLREHGGELRL